ncbi:HAD family phosphatase [Segetibacter sp. 3557_3]|uniref:HAD family hydrolase n=1 Tax=Segetibacter sp. 3557_3 TaxID=2547429 RepID=UPI001058CB77|nr:HAD family phosphatase [Segetibacter sp. 3557_3]TDH21482.1 HAD family phosphatase [Segetibacter sp. 3557_3]
MNIAVLFDMDGVIVDSNPYHKKAFEQFFEEHEVSLSDEELKTHVYGRTNKEIMPYVFKDDYTPEKGEVWADEKEALFRDLYKSDIEPVKDLVPFLQQLRAANIKTAVGTSAPRANLDFVLDALAIREYFDALLDSTDVISGKPDPEIYLNSAQKLGIDPSACIVIEDSLAGVQAGLSAGMKVIGITTTHTPEELANTHLVIDDYEGLTVDRLLALVG